MVLKTLQAEMVQAYEEGLSTRDVGRKFGMSKMACVKALASVGVSARSREVACRRYRLDDTFFDTINTEERAYWLGFLVADGGIVNSRLVLGLQTVDLGHLRKFAASIETDQPILIGKKDVRLQISSAPLVRSLSRLGLRQRKSHDVVPPTVPSSLLPAFWRGVVDGDGTIGLGRKGIVRLVGNRRVTEAFLEWARTFIPTKATVRPAGRIFSASVGGRHQMQRLLQVLYGNATIFLDRKLVRARTWMED